jgi:hypothetical protein
MKTFVCDFAFEKATMYYIKVSLRSLKSSHHLEEGDCQKSTFDFMKTIKRISVLHKAIFGFEKDIFMITTTLLKVLQRRP